jgi:tRNA dimethylallyltransferase
MDGIDTKAVLICGPTASGKSALALELAREFGVVVINAAWRNQG